MANQLLASSGSWDGIPGQDDTWPSHLRVEFHDENGKTRLVLREGPHPVGTAEMGRVAWQMMFAKLDTLLADSAWPIQERSCKHDGAVLRVDTLGSITDMTAVTANW